MSVYQKMTDKLLLTGSRIIPELFRMIADEREAELLMSMPGTPEKLAAMMGMDRKETEKMCDELYTKGLAFKSFKEGGISYKMCRDMIQFHDATILWPEAPREYHDLWQEFMETEWPTFARLADQFFPKPLTRVIAVEESVDSGEQTILDADSTAGIIESADCLAVTRCTCRVIAHKCDMPIEACIQVNNAARYTLNRGTGREISKEEAHGIIRECEKKGLVHITMNKSHAGHFICNCCSCCCQTLPLIISERLKLTDPSRYTAVIDYTRCTACGTCSTRCKFDAIEVVVNNDGDDLVSVIEELCMGCGLCGITCPESALTLKETRPSDFIPS